MYKSCINGTPGTIRIYCIYVRTYRNIIVGDFVDRPGPTGLEHCFAYTDDSTYPTYIKDYVLDLSRGESTVVVVVDGGARDGNLRGTLLEQMLLGRGPRGAYVASHLERRRLLVENSSFCNCEHNVPATTVLGGNHT